MLILILISLFLFYSCSDNIVEPGPKEPILEWTKPSFNEQKFAQIVTFPDSLIEPDYLRIIAAADERVAYVSDWMTKLIAKTADGGTSWKIIEPPVQGGIYTIEVFDSLFVWVGAQSGEIIKSSDGGKTWVKQYAGKFINYIKFFDANNGIAVGDGNPLEILHTSDGGDSWINKNSILNYGTTHYAVDFADHDNGLIRTVPDQKYVYKTMDGGVSWDTLYPGNSDYIHTLVCLGKSISILSYYKSPWRTNDGGLTWQKLDNSEILNGTFERFSKIAGRPNIVWGILDGLLGSKNDGESWKRIDTGFEIVNQKWHDLSSPKENVIWLSGSNGRVTYTIKADSLLNE